MFKYGVVYWKIGSSKKKDGPHEIAEIEAKNLKTAGSEAIIKIADQTRTTSDIIVQINVKRLPAGGSHRVF